MAAATLDSSVDIRPRVWDTVSKSWTLVDTGSQVSVLKPSQGDVLRPDLLLESVDGSRLKCYGKKEHSVRLGRKEYHIQAVISDTTDNILGMDFIMKYKLDFRWGPFGDLYLFDPKSQSSTLCQFVKIPRDANLPRVASVSVVNNPPASLPELPTIPHPLMTSSSKPT